MADQCVFKPTVKNKISKLYDDLYNFTGKDRPLTNLLYALSLQDDVKKLFSRSDFNSQGEIASAKFISKFNVLKMLDNKKRIQVVSKALGFMDSSGNPIKFDTMDPITSKVINFNKTLDEYRAKVKFTDDKKFTVEVEIVNAENFNSATLLEKRDTIYKAVLTYLSSLGFTTSLSDTTKKYFNPLNVYYSVSLLNDLSLDSFNLPISINRAQLILDLLGHMPSVQRFVVLFGNLSAEVLSMFSGADSAIDPATIPNAAYWKGKTFDVLSDAEVQFHRINRKNLLNAINSASAALPTPKYKGIDGMSIEDTLDLLYSVYHLDKNIKVVANKEIKQVSKAAEELLRLSIKKFELARGNFAERRELEGLQKQISMGKYLKSIAVLLLNLLDDIQGFETTWKALETKYSGDLRSLSTQDAINEMASVVYKQMREYNAFESIIHLLENLDTLTNDDVDADPAVVNHIKSAAASIAKEIRLAKSNGENGLLAKQFDLVYAFLKIYWGEDKDKSFDGLDFVLEDMLNAAAHDIGFYNRYLTAATESEDPILALVGEAVKAAKDKRDKRVGILLTDIRSITESLYKKSDSSFMYIKKNGVPTGKLLSPYDFDKFEEEKDKYEKSLKTKKLDKVQRQKMMSDWYIKHTKVVKPFADLDYEIRVPIFDKTNWDSGLTPELKTYYKEAMHIKAEYHMISPLWYDGLYDAVLLSATFTEKSFELGGIHLYKAMKDKFVKSYSVANDNDDYAALMKSGLLALHLTDYDGRPLNRIPLFYTHELADPSMLSTDFSRSLLAFCSSAILYQELSRIEDTMLLTKDFLLNRKVNQTKGDAFIGDLFGVGKEKDITRALKSASETKEGGYIEDLYERILYNVKKKDDLYIGNKVSVGRAADTLTGVSSVLHLSVNALGALANLFVGKIQMWIDSGLGMGGEFFGVKNLIKADGQYFQLLPEFLAEYNSNTKHSKLGLLMEKFDITQDWYLKLKESGFHKSEIGKILGNTNLLFLYGLGEHVMRGQTMLACLDHIKVKNNRGKVVPLFDAFEVDKTGKTGELVIKAGYTTLDGNAIDDDFLLKAKKRISYVNKSMHGAFNEDDKGMAHRYAIGRLLLNFRQWMPAHYGRRFAARYYDADLGEFREGYYNTAYKFLAGCVLDLKDKKFDIGTRWGKMSKSLQYNLKRTIAEVTILMILSTALRVIPDEKDKKGNWAYRNLIYQLKRMEMETMASTPVWIPWSKQSPLSFERNIIKTLNSPAAALSTIEDLSVLLDFTKAFDTIDSGKHKGENRYLYNLERKFPFYGQIKRQIEMKDSDDYFRVFR